MHEAERGVDHVMDAAIELPQHYIETETSLVQRALRSLKHEDAFAVFDDYGDIGVGRTGPEGVYFNDTRFLSWYELRFEGMRPLLLSSDVQDDNAALSVDLANPDVHADDGISLPRDTIAFERTKFLWQAVCYERIGFRTMPTATDAFALTFVSVPIFVICSRCAVKHAPSAAKSLPSSPRRASSFITKGSTI
jgi:glycogen debranching enzyme